MEFALRTSVKDALTLDGSVLLDREIQVVRKEDNPEPKEPKESRGAVAGERGAEDASMATEAVAEGQGGAGEGGEAGAEAAAGQATGLDALVGGLTRGGR